MKTTWMLVVLYYNSSAVPLPERYSAQADCLLAMTTATLDVMNWRGEGLRFRCVPVVTP